MSPSVSSCACVTWRIEHSTSPWASRGPTCRPRPTAPSVRPARAQPGGDVQVLLVSDRVEPTVGIDPAAHAPCALTTAIRDRPWRSLREALSARSEDPGEPFVEVAHWRLARPWFEMLAPDAVDAPCDRGAATPRRQRDSFGQQLARAFRPAQSHVRSRGPSGWRRGRCEAGRVRSPRAPRARRPAGPASGSSCPGTRRRPTRRSPSGPRRATGSVPAATAAAATAAPAASM